MPAVVIISLPYFQYHILTADAHAFMPARRWHRRYFAVAFGDRHDASDYRRLLMRDHREKPRLLGALAA